MYSIIEITESPEDGVWLTKALPFEDIPEDEIDYVVNVLRMEGRSVLAVRDVPREDPFEDPSPAPTLKWTKRFLAASVLLTATGTAIRYAHNSGLLEQLTG